MALRALPLRVTTICCTFGEETGKTLSTPMPDATLRTVKVSFGPLPCLARTVPSKACVRSLSPSTIRQ